MKALLISVLLIFGAMSSARADQWPYDEVCRKFNVPSETVKISTPREQTVVLCKFGNDSYLDKISLKKSWDSAWDTWAIREYKNNRPTPFTESCSHYGAWIQVGVDSLGKKYQLCVFGDNSIMEFQTFGHGPHSGWNTQMDWTLGIQ